MEREKGVVLVVYKKPSRNPRYLVLNRKKNWEGWELPKGHLEKDDYEHTARLELSEEAGIEAIEELESTEQVLEWSFEDDDGQTIKREYKAFIVKVDEGAVTDTSANPHDEHERGHFFNYEDAKSLLTHQNQKEILDALHETITR
ncbi:NUDIX domain-containing protein [Candidatus Nanohalococcus occultus]|uniref:NUDIX domain-containing protein n=1 Tax=Candidatus Nanohalococcus occultus TaxID=2978047 RepID=UPI0039DF7FC5